MRTFYVAGLALAVLGAALLTGCPDPEPLLAVSAKTHHFFGDPYTGNFETEWTLTLWNGGDEGTNLYIELGCDEEWIDIEPDEGISAGTNNPLEVTISVNRNYSGWAKMTQAFATAQINIISTGGNDIVTVTTSPNFYTEVFNEFTRRENDLSGRAFTYMPDGSLSYYGVRMTEEVAEFPSNPGAAMLLDFDVADPYEITLPAGWAIPFYGKQYAKLFVSSKGYVSLGDPGNVPTTIGAHFLSPQVSALPVDARVSANSMVSFGMDDEHAFVTFEDAPSLSVAPESSNDFQIEFFFDETIRMAYPNVDAANTEGVVGFSPGGGDGSHPLEDDFVISDLTDATTAPLGVKYLAW